MRARGNATVASGAEGPEQLAQDIWLALRGRDWDRVKELLHPEAQLELAIAPGEILGATETVERWRSAIEQGLFDPKPVGFMELDSNRVFVTGRIKPGTELGNSDSARADVQGRPSLANELHLPRRDRTTGEPQARLTYRLAFGAPGRRDLLRVGNDTMEPAKGTGATRPAGRPGGSP